jgi:class 3 adenylate cyclase
LAIAYQVHGSGDYDIVFAGPLSNIGAQWDLPEARRLFERLGRFARVIRYDRRDVGLSDPIRDDLALEAHAQDALAVMAAVSARRPVLVGSLDASRGLALLAAMHPETVSGLIAVAPSVRVATASAPEMVQAIVRRVVEHDGPDLDWPEVILPFAAPGWMGDPVRRERLARFLVSAATPRQVKRWLRMTIQSDVADVLPLVQAPTLVLHPRDVPFPSQAAVREFADLIPGAEYREIPGDAVMIYALDMDLLADTIEEFVTGHRPTPITNRVLATVLFTDLVDSTSHAAAAGDRAWTQRLEQHLADSRETVAAFGGDLIKTTGDGVLAVFAGPAQGVRCAEQVISHAHDVDLDARIGLHTGEVERSPDDVAGLAVHIAARIMSTAQPGEILVSRTVRDLVIGSELRFTERGEHTLRGVADTWMLYAAKS